MLDWLFVYLFVQINVNACFNTYLGYFTTVRLCSGLGFTVCCIGASVVWQLSLPLMNSFNKTEAVIIQRRLCFLWAFHFLSLILLRDKATNCLLTISQL